MSEYVKLYTASENVCDYCKESDSNLIRPCGNSECEIYFHPECQKKKIAEGNDKCDKCAQPIVIIKTQKFKLGICCNTVFRIAITSLLFILGTITPGLLIFGTTVANTKEMGPDVGWTIMGVFTGMLSMVIGIIPLLIFGFDLSETNKKYFINIMEFLNIKYQEYERHYLLFMVLCAIYLAILMCHFFGFLILKFIFNYDNMFNYKTFDTGLIFFILCGISLWIIYVIVCSCKKLYNSSLEEETTFGSTKKQ